MKYLKKLLINKNLNLSELKNIKIDELKIRPDEAKKIDDTSMINFINFLKVYKNNGVEIGNEKEIIISAKGMMSKYKLTPKNKDFILSLINNNPVLKDFFKDIE